MTVAPELSIVIVTYRTRKLVLECLASVYEDLKATSFSHQIIVVDNYSNDGTIEAIQENFPEVIIIANNENLGPARAYNQGIRKSIDSSYIMLLNSDILVLPGTINAMHDYLVNHADVAGVCGDLFFPDGRRQLVRTAIIASIKPSYRRIFRVTFMGTGFQMTRSRVWQDVGLLDENYFFYNEDLDWITRAVRRGHRFMFLPQARVIHYQAQGAKQNRSRITRELFPSNLYYFQKHYPILAFLAYWAIMLDIKLRLRRTRAALARESAKAADPAALAALAGSLADLTEAQRKVRALAGARARTRPASQSSR